MYDKSLNYIKKLLSILNMLIFKLHIIEINSDLNSSNEHLNFKLRLKE